MQNTRTLYFIQIHVRFTLFIIQYCRFITRSDKRRQVSLKQTRKIFANFIYHFMKEYRKNQTSSILMPKGNLHVASRLQTLNHSKVSYSREMTELPYNCGSSWSCQSSPERLGCDGPPVGLLSCTPLR